MSSIRVVAALMVFTAACARTESGASDTAAARETAAAAATNRATAAATVSNAIAANPAAADSILKANGYTADEFERALYEIAGDSVQSAAYAAAKTK